ncbi:unnamed protein product [Ceratitis capitata]|uniref:(Mediterranean fruit fly) hypothetical protein n=1 Tax=Ceratitis capitata TaxID=7213 RepID=A0A811UWI1_CERCA|nr:unnamed protein product [Ceratitis capitata]
MPQISKAPLPRSINRNHNNADFAVFDFKSEARGQQLGDDQEVMEQAQSTLIIKAQNRQWLHASWSLMRDSSWLN